MLAFDLATTTGWAFDGPVRGVPEFGAFRVPAPDGDNQLGFELGRSFLRFEEKMTELIWRARPETIAFEAPLTLVHGGQSSVKTNANTVRMLFGLAAITELVAARLKINTYEANVMSIKKGFAGSGRADKAAMMARCRQLGWMVTEHNAADACGLWSHVRSLQDPKFSVGTTPLFGARR